MNNSRYQLGKTIAELRKKRQLSQSQLAKSLNIGSSTLGMYETGKREPNNAMLTKIADYFNVSTDFLLGRDEGNDSNTLAWQDLGMAYGGNIPDELKDMYRALAEEYVRKHPEALDRNRPK
ncbi:MAG: helix-turn-helix domain-containing protein [Lactobacillus sp.]|nr:helix-turn-helix domain-containing protein [Lactobacillus sp.]QHJ81245.1 MAG: Cro/C1-type helix-turn-helix domain protein [Caudoviricetes sp.]